MTDFGDLQDQIADYANRQDWSDTLVVGFIRQAEQKFNAELRIDRMHNTVEGTVAARCASLPDDWLEMEFVSIADTNYPNGWRPIHYMPRDEFFRSPDSTSYSRVSTWGKYTLEGRVITFGGPPDLVNGVNFQLVYFSEVPIFADIQQSYIYTKYPSLYLYSSLIFADLHAVGEEQNAANMKSLADDIIGKLNANYLRSKASGSRLSRSRRRSFG